MNEFSKLCEMFPKEVSTIMEGIEKIDVDNAIDDVEKEIDNSVPYSVRYWLRKSIMNRKQDLINIYHKSVKKL